MNINEYITVANSTANKSRFEYFKRNIFKHTLVWEGGGKLHNVAGDSGGWTIWGIAYNYNKKVFKDLVDFKDTTYEEACAIAFCRYYLTAEVFRVPDSAKLMYFDMCYNLGTTRSIKYMQECIGVGNDGNIGPMTRLSMSKLTEDCLYNKRKGWYNYLIRQNIKMQKFFKGWMNRTEAIKKVD